MLISHYPFRAEPLALRITLFEGGGNNMGKTANKQEDKTQGEEAVEQGQAISEEEPREDKAKKFPSFRPRYYRPGCGTTAPRYYRTYYRNYYRKQQREYGSDY